ncbi:MAG TPA: PIN domain-containing protein [Methylomirabilota bacterium]|jgi:predicted nucleic acid-binding protein|nr:PIN domain-containing protein [Methylomirabilota bacterium]
MIFLDTSAIYAMADRGDTRHRDAVHRFQAALEEGSGILTHNYVLLESMALVQHRLGLAAALSLARDSEAFAVEWVDGAVHAEAVRRLARSRRRRTSLVDEVSFLVMRARGVEAALAFDRDFEFEGFRLYEG